MIPTKVVATDGHMVIVADGKEFHVLIEGQAFSFVAANTTVVRINPRMNCLLCEGPCIHTRLVARWLLQLFPGEVPDAKT